MNKKIYVYMSLLSNDDNFFFSVILYDYDFSILVHITATDVVTVYVFQEPSLLSPLQDNGLTDVVLHALLVKDVSHN